MATTEDAFRRKLAEQLNTIATEEGFEPILRDILSTTKEVRIRCEHCKRNIHATISDALAVARALATLGDQGFGKPTETIKTEHAGRIELERIGELTDEELALLAGAA